MSKSLTNLKRLVALSFVTRINMRVAKIKPTQDVLEYVSTNKNLSFGNIEDELLISRDI